MDDSVTQLLIDWRAGDDGARDKLWPFIYEELKRLAGHYMSDQKVGHTLQATALVNEAYLRMVGDVRLEWSERSQFYIAASEAMRRILVDHARKRASQKRQQDRPRVSLDVADLSVDYDPDRVLDLDEAIARLEKQDERTASVVRLRFYAGLSVEETAQALDVSERTVMREWSYARAWLFDALDGEASDGGESGAAGR